MRKVTVVVDERCRQKANFEHDAGKGICRCCMVFNAMTNAGIAVESVGRSTFSIAGFPRERFELPDDAQNITQLYSGDWNRLRLPKTFEVEVPDEAMVPHAK